MENIINSEHGVTFFLLGIDHVLEFCTVIADYK